MVAADVALKTDVVRAVDPGYLLTFLGLTNVHEIAEEFSRSVACLTGYAFVHVLPIAWVVACGVALVALLSVILVSLNKIRGLLDPLKTGELGPLPLFGMGGSQPGVTPEALLTAYVDGLFSCYAVIPEVPPDWRKVGVCLFWRKFREFQPEFKDLVSGGHPLLHLAAVGVHPPVGLLFCEGPADTFMAYGTAVYVKGEF
jgi:hypothetical protein